MRAGAWQLPPDTGMNRCHLLMCVHIMGLFTEYISHTDRVSFIFFLSNTSVFLSLSVTHTHTHTHTTTATSSAHLEDLAYLDEQRHTPLRTSLRMPRQSTTCGPGRSGQDLRGESCREHTHANTHKHTHPLPPLPMKAAGKIQIQLKDIKDVSYWILSRDTGVLVYLC